MIKKTVIILSTIFAFIVLSALYNYILAQKAIRETKTSVLTTDLVSYPESIYTGNVGTFFWKVQTPSDLSATTTSIYWGHQSSASAVTMTDSPESLAYPNFTTDYQTGSFKLPDTFDSQVTFDRAGIIYFRSYAKVGEHNLWSKEYSLTVVPREK